jgi:hypothetical protein
VGGDHGKGSFKFVYQILNVERPNAKTNTIAIAYFESKDFRPNLEVALKRFNKEFIALQNTTWE